jgi:WD40 repeat protein
VHLSNRGKKIGQATYYGVNEKGANSMNFQMMDEEGKVLWQTDNLFGSEHISDAEGDVVVELECHEGGCERAVIFHDKQNPKGMKVIPDVDERAEISGGYLSEDGKCLIVKYMIWQGPDEFVFELVLFDVIAKKPLWVKRFEEETIYDIAVSIQGNFSLIMACNEKKECFMYVFDRQGNRVLTQQSERIGNFVFDFSSDEKYMAAASSKGEIYLFDIDSRKLLWKYSASDENLGFLDADISTGFVATSVTTKNPKNRNDGSLPRYLYVFDYQGNLILSKKFTGHGLNRWGEGLKVNLDNSGKKVRVMLKEKLYEFENEFAR